MRLEFIERTDQDDEGRRYLVHFLVDADSFRAYGYVEEPKKGTNQVMFVANPYEGKSRWYMKLEPAKSYLEECTLREEAENSMLMEREFAANKVAQ